MIALGLWDLSEASRIGLMILGAVALTTYLGLRGLRSPDRRGFLLPLPGRRHAGYLPALLVICGVGAFATWVGFTSADPWTWRMCVAAGVFLAMVPFGVRTWWIGRRSAGSG